jgi:hypothetical protein
VTNTIPLITLGEVRLLDLLPLLIRQGLGSSQFNLDYALAVRRSCFEGKETWLGNGYHAWDLWGYIGRWYSGGWYVGGAQDYINQVKNIWRIKIGYSRVFNPLASRTKSSWLVLNLVGISTPVRLLQPHLNSYKNQISIEKLYL